MFQDGVKKTILISSWALAWLKQPRTPSNPRDITPQKGTHPPGPIQTSQTLDNPWCSTVPRPQVVQEIYYIGGTGFLCLPFSNFRYSLTLFSKFFASFPHGTCALLVSHQYLVLDGIYHQLWAAIPSNSTRWEYLLKLKTQGMNGSVTHYAALFQGTYPWVTTDGTSIDHNSAHKKWCRFGMNCSRFTRRY